MVNVRMAKMVGSGSCLGVSDKAMLGRSEVEE